MDYMIITDASVIGSVKGPAGWAARVGTKIESGYIHGPIGNNQAELMAILFAVVLAPPDCNLSIYTDSKFAIRWINGMPSSMPLIRNMVDGIRTASRDGGKRIMRLSHIRDLGPAFYLHHQLHKLAISNAHEAWYRYYC